jgi:hypothetical protein
MLFFNKFLAPCVITRRWRRSRAFAPGCSAYSPSPGCPSQKAPQATHTLLRESDFTEVKSMKLKFLFAMVVAFAFSLGAIAQQQDDSGIKQDTKDAAHSTGKAAKKTGHKIKKGTKKVVNKSADATEKGADKVKDKSAPKPTPPPEK